MTPTSTSAASRAARATAEAAGIKRDLRSQLCVGAKHPGRPDEYRVSVRATCVAASGEARRAADAGRRKRREARATPADAQTRAEIKRIERALKDAPPDATLGPHDQGVTMEISFTVLANMVNPARRLHSPDPVERYDGLLALYKRQPSKVDTDLVQRRMILRATLEHLKAVLGTVVRARGPARSAS